MEKAHAAIIAVMGFYLAAPSLLLSTLFATGENAWVALLAVELLAVPHRF